MKKEVLLYVLFIFAFSTGTIFAQSYNDEEKKQLDYIKPGTTNFLMRGYSHAGFEAIDGNNSFISGAFAYGNKERKFFLRVNWKLNSKVMGHSLLWNMLIFLTF